MVVYPCFCPKVPNLPEGLLRPMPRRPLMVRAALLRRSCDGVAAATDMRRPAPSRSFCASRLSIIFPPVDSNFKSWPTVLGHPPGPVIIPSGLFKIKIHLCRWHKRQMDQCQLLVPRMRLRLLQRYPACRCHSRNRGFVFQPQPEEICVRVSNN